MTTIKAILFDKDGTLLDYHETWTPVHLDAARIAAGGDPGLVGKFLDLADADARTGRARPGGLFAAGNAAEIADVWAAHGAALPRGALVVALDDLFVEAMREARPIDGTAEVIRALADRGYALGVASSDSERSICTFLAAAGIADVFTFVAGYDSGYGHKPEPGMVTGFCEALGLEAASVAVVGDNVQDLQMARAGGAGLGVGVLSGTGTQTDLAVCGDVVIADIRDLDACLSGLSETDESLSYRLRRDPSRRSLFSKDEANISKHPR